MLIGEKTNSHSVTKSHKNVSGDTAPYFGVSGREILKCVLEESSNWGSKYLRSDYEERKTNEMQHLDVYY